MKTSSCTATEHFNQFKPTWTGKFGVNSRFGSNNNNPLNNADAETAASSITAQDILEAINERKSRPTRETDSNIKLALDLVDYFNRVGGKVASDRLAHSFQGSSSRSRIGDCVWTIQRRLLLSINGIVFGILIPISKKK